MPGFGDADVNDLVFLTQLEFKVHDLHEVIMVALPVTFKDERAQVAAVPNLVSTLVKVSTVDVEDRLVADVGWSVVLHSEATEVSKLLGEGGFPDSVGTAKEDEHKSDATVADRNDST